MSENSDVICQPTMMSVNNYVSSWWWQQMMISVHSQCRAGLNHFVTSFGKHWAYWREAPLRRRPCIGRRACYIPRTQSCPLRELDGSSVRRPEVSNLQHSRDSWLVPSACFGLLPPRLLPGLWWINICSQDCCSLSPQQTTETVMGETKTLIWNITLALSKNIWQWSF